LDIVKPVTLEGCKRLIPAIRPNSKNLNKKWEADFRFFRNRPFAAEVINLGAATQERELNSSGGGLLSSDNGH
jgi:hypothetical protein